KNRPGALIGMIDKAEGTIPKQAVHAFLKSSAGRECLLSAFLRDFEDLYLDQSHWVGQFLIYGPSSKPFQSLKNCGRGLVGLQKHPVFHKKLRFWCDFHSKAAESQGAAGYPTSLPGI